MSFAQVEKGEGGGGVGDLRRQNSSLRMSHCSSHCLFICGSTKQVIQ